MFKKAPAPVATKRVQKVVTRLVADGAQSLHCYAVWGMNLDGDRMIVAGFHELLKRGDIAFRKASRIRTRDLKICRAGAEQKGYEDN